MNCICREGSGIQDKNSTYYMIRHFSMDTTELRYSDVELVYELLWFPTTLTVPRHWCMNVILKFHILKPAKPLNISIHSRALLEAILSQLVTL